MTQEQLAKKAKVSRSAVARMELGESDPSISTLFKLLVALETWPGEFFTSEIAEV